MDLFLDLDETNSSDLSAHPTKRPFLQDLDLDQDVTRRLSLHLDGIESGNNDVYVTPVTKEHSPQIILELWDNIFNSKLDQMNDVLLNLEAANRSKFGPRSISIPWKDRLVNVSRYFENRPRVLSHAIPKSVEGLVPDTLNLRPLSISNTIKLLKNDTNSGLPFYCRKSKVKDRLATKFQKYLRRQDPCILFTRTQESNKTRDVWGFPIADTLNEMRFYEPLLKFQKTQVWRAAIRGPKDVDVQVTRLINEAVSNGLKLLSIDFSSFDSTVSQELIDQSFSYIRSLFQPKYWSEIEYIRDRFSTIPLLTPSGVISGCHGVPSGSTFTNEVDSLAQFYASYSSGLVDFDNCLIQGDDGVYLLKNESDVLKLIDTLKGQGLKVNEDKSYVASDYCIYLQNLYHPDYRGNNGIIGGVYPVYRALNRIVYQERWSDFEDFGLSGKDYYSIRTISILENCKHHPLFKDLVKFIYSLDKYSLGYTQDGLNKYCNLLNEGKGTGGFLNNQYGDDIRGISNFATIKVLKELA